MKIYYFYIWWKTRIPEMDCNWPYLKNAEKWECYFYPEYSDFFYWIYKEKFRSKKGYYKDLEIYLKNPKSKEKDTISWAFNWIMIFSEKLKSLLEEFNIPFEFYPVKCRWKVYYLVWEDNIPIIDWVNLEKSELKFFPSDWSLMDIKKYVFNEEKIWNNLVFKIPNLNSSRLFCTEKFLKILTENKITWFIFHNTAEYSYFRDNNIYL